MRKQCILTVLIALFFLIEVNEGRKREIPIGNVLEKCDSDKKVLIVLKNYSFVRFLMKIPFFP